MKVKQTHFTISKLKYVQTLWFYLQINTVWILNFYTSVELNPSTWVSLCVPWAHCDMFEQTPHTLWSAPFYCWFVYFWSLYDWSPSWLVGACARHNKTPVNMGKRGLQRPFPTPWPSNQAARGLAGLRWHGWVGGPRSPSLRHLTSSFSCWLSPWPFVLLNHTNTLCQSQNDIGIGVL